MRLTKAQLKQITDDLRLSPETFGYSQTRWTGPSLCRHLKNCYQVVYGQRQCRRMVQSLVGRRPQASSANVCKAQVTADRVEIRPWSGFSDTYRQEKTLQRLRQLSLANLPLKSFAASLFELLAAATNSGDAAQGILLGDGRTQRWMFRDVETLEWTIAHMAEHRRANSDDPSISGMLIGYSALPFMKEAVLASARFMGPRFHESPAYDELWRHHGIYSGAMTLLRDGGKLVGFAPVWKSRKEKPLTRGDVHFLETALPFITHGVLLSQAAPLDSSALISTAIASGRTGIVTTDWSGRVVAMDDAARALFCQPAMLDGHGLDAFSSCNLRAALRGVSTIIRQTFHNAGERAGDPLAVPTARVWWHGSGCVLLLRATLP